MQRVLFVTNGHGEIAIGDRIARELRQLEPAWEIDHLALVGDIPMTNARDVGPRRGMPSGGLIAMGNVRNIVGDVRAGLLPLGASQWRFLRRCRGRYAAAVAVGDAFALLLALQACTRTVFVGTAKSVYVAPYGRVERRILRRAHAVIVRDEPTAEDLRAYGVMASAGNVIADLFSEGEPLPTAAMADFDRVIGLFPGSRVHAYGDAVFLVSVVSDLARRRAGLGAILSIAPGVDAGIMAASLRAAGFAMSSGPNDLVPFEIAAGSRIVARAWRGSAGSVLAQSSIVLGQAGTANEAAAAAGVPVIAFRSGVDRENAWYRSRQGRLLGDALTVVPEDRTIAAKIVEDLLDDPERLRRLGTIGRERMGSPGAARTIACRITELACPS
jgi:uncharacterized protein (TIGR03492 family)